jgi:hypothetical protein
MVRYSSFGESDTSSSLQFIREELLNTPSKPAF